jgi:hypothetical protein
VRSAWRQNAVVEGLLRSLCHSSVAFVPPRHRIASWTGPGSFHPAISIPVAGPMRSTLIPSEVVEWVCVWGLSLSSCCGHFVSAALRVVVFLSQIAFERKGMFFHWMRKTLGTCLGYIYEFLRMDQIDGRGHQLMHISIAILWNGLHRIVWKYTRYC